MMLDFVLAGLAGLALGVLINFLADRLPELRADIDEAEEDQEPVVAAPTAPKRAVSLFSLAAGAVPGGYAAPPSARLLRYPLSEIGLLLVSVLLFQRYGWGASFAISLFYLSLFTLIAIIDIEHRLVLNIVMIPAFIIALFEVAFSRRIPLDDGLIGFATSQIGTMALYLLGLVYLWVLNTNREEPITEVAFGFGDVTLATFCGLVIGRGALLMLVLMIIFGAAMAILHIASRMLIRRRYSANAAIPYAPAIVLAASAMFLAGDRVVWFLF